MQFELRSEGKGGQMRDSPAPGPSTVLVGPALGTVGVAFGNGAAEDRRACVVPNLNSNLGRVAGDRRSQIPGSCW